MIQTSIPRVRLAVALALAGLAAGCADQLSFASDSRDAGIEQYKNADYANAAGSFKNAIRQAPEEYTDYYWLGASYDALGNEQQAIPAFKSCLDVMKQTLAGKQDHAFRMRTINALAAAISKTNDKTTQLNSLEAQADKDDSAEEYLILAKVYRDSQDPDSALNAYSKAALLDPGNFDVAKDYGLYLVQLNQTQKAETVLRTAHSLNGKDQQVNDALQQLGVAV